MAIVAVAVAIAAALTPSAALAAFPGSNGRIAYTAQTGLLPSGRLKTDIFTVLLDGSGAQQLTDDSAGDEEPSWSADGRRLVFTRGFPGVRNVQIFTMSADGGDLVRVIDTGHPFPSASPSFSPNGRRILYTNGGSIRTVRTDGTDPRRILKGNVTEPTYSPSGKRIAFAGVPGGKERDGIWSVRRDGSRLRRLTDTERMDAEIANISPDYSPDGRHIVFQRYGYRENLGMHVMRADGSGEHPIPGTGDVGTPAYAPDGKRIVAAIATGVALYSSCSDVYSMSPTASDRQRLTDYCNPHPDGSGSTFSAYSPSWQPLPGMP